MNDLPSQYSEGQFEQGKNYAMRRLAKRECSSHDISIRLRQKGISEENIEAILTDLKKRNFLNDERFANLLIRQHARLAKGARFIQQKLKEHNIDLSVTQIQEMASEEADYNELENAKTLVHKKYSQFAEDPKIYRRAVSALQRRGFNMDTILAALQK